LFDRHKIGLLLYNANNRTIRFFVRMRGCLVIPPMQASGLTAIFFPLFGKYTCHRGLPLLVQMRYREQPAYHREHETHAPRLVPSCCSGYPSVAVAHAVSVQRTDKRKQKYSYPKKVH
jgi:hypothetical protein